MVSLQLGAVYKSQAVDRVLLTSYRHHCSSPHTYCITIYPQYPLLNDASHLPFLPRRVSHNHLRFPPYRPTGRDALPGLRRRALEGGRYLRIPSPQSVDRCVWHHLLHRLPGLDLPGGRHRQNEGAARPHA